jgi:subtilisin family serine protease
VITAGGPASAVQASTWNFNQTSVPAAQPLGNYGRGVLVAVVDTWIDPDQPQFGGRLVDEADCLSGSCQDHTYAPDTCVHGTHVAGIVASSDYGIAPDAELLSVQVLSGPAGHQNNPNASCSGSDASVAAGIGFAVAKGARVINLSLADQVPGLFQSSAIRSAVQQAAAKGVVVIFAAGNDDLPITDSYGTSAMLVAATGPSGQLASYSNYNSAVTGDVNVAAPGGDTGSSSSCTAADCILSTFPHNSAGLLQGTSMAAPAVAGLAALLIAQDPARSAANVISTIEKTSTTMAGAGSGRIADRAALQVEAASHPPSVTTTTVAGGPTGTTVAPPAPAAGGGAGGSASITPAQIGAPVSGGSSPLVAGVGPGLAPTSPTTRSPSTTMSGGHAGGPIVAAPARRPTTGLVVNTSKGDWTGHHAAILVLACLLLGGVILAGLWTRESRRLFTRH